MDRSLKSQLDRLSSLAVYRPLKAVLDRSAGRPLANPASSRKQDWRDWSRQTSLDERMIQVVLAGCQDLRSSDSCDCAETGSPDRAAGPSQARQTE